MALKWSVLDDRWFIHIELRLQMVETLQRQKGGTRIYQQPYVFLHTKVGPTSRRTWAIRSGSPRWEKAACVTDVCMKPDTLLHPGPWPPESHRNGWPGPWAIQIRPWSTGSMAAMFRTLPGRTARHLRDNILLSSRKRATRIGTILGTIAIFRLILTRYHTEITANMIGRDDWI